MNDDLLGDGSVKEVAARSNSSIAARLEALRRGPHTVGPASAAVLPLMQLDNNQLHQTAAESGPERQPTMTGSLAALAAELFGDERFKAACAKGLNARLQVSCLRRGCLRQSDQPHSAKLSSRRTGHPIEHGGVASLQRTRDGATAESRISELAGKVDLPHELVAESFEELRHGRQLALRCAALVKLLRRSLTQLTARNDEFVRRSLELEHHCSKQVPVEHVQLKNSLSVALSAAQSFVAYSRGRCTPAVWRQSPAPGPFRLNWRWPSAMPPRLHLRSNLPWRRGMRSSSGRRRRCAGFGSVFEP